MREWRIPIVFITLSLLYFGSVFSLYGLTEESTRICIRISARISFVFFCLAFMASGLQYLYKGQFTFWMLMNRKFIGITFAIIHLIHLCLLGILQLEFHPVFELADIASLIGGGVAYVFIVIMLITSFDAIKSKISSNNWKMTHTIGGYWIAAVFLTSYGKRALSEWEYIPLLCLLLVTLLLRAAKYFRI